MADQQRQDLYQATREVLLKRNLSNSLHLDKAILTLSSAALGLSVTGIRFMVDIEDIAALPLIIVAWSLFVLAIVITLISFHVSQRAIAAQLKAAEDYYLEDDSTALHRTNVPSLMTNLLAYLLISVFVAAIICCVVFVALNLRDRQMPDDGPNNTQARSIVPLKERAAQLSSDTSDAKGTASKRTRPFNAGHFDQPTALTLPPPDTNESQAPDRGQADSS